MVGLHAGLAYAVVALNVVLFAIGFMGQKNGKGKNPLFSALTGIGHLLLIAVIAIGLVMWMRGGRPTDQMQLNTLHVTSGLLALLAPFALIPLRRSIAPDAKWFTPLITLLFAALALWIGLRT